MNLNSLFDSIATKVTNFTGSYAAFCIAVFLIILWAGCGPIFHFSETWQLVINTGTTIITFLMVFLIQYSQNKDTKALHLKLDELIKVNKSASDKLRGIESLSQEQFEQIKREL